MAAMKENAALEKHFLNLENYNIGNKTQPAKKYIFQMLLSSEL